MIGIVDAETFRKQKTFIPNLEAMKLYAWAKKHREFPQLLGDSSLLEACDQVYIFQDKLDAPMPQYFFQHRNVVVRGAAFTGGDYKEFPNMEIENTSPTIDCYSQYIEKKLAIASSKEKIYYNTLLNRAGFIRLHSKGRLQVEQFPQEKWGVTYIYDKDITKNNGLELLVDLSKKARPYDLPRLRYYWPIKLKTPDQFLYLFENGLIQNSVILQRYCPAEVVLDFDTEYSYIKEYLDMINLPVTNYSFSVSVPMTPASKLQDNLTKEKSLQYLSNCLRLYYDCLADKKRFNVYYEDNINNPYDRLYKIIRTNLNQIYKNEYSVYSAVSVYDKEELPILLSLFPENSKYRACLTRSRNDVLRRGL